jgi:hypothetical protein
MITFFGLFGDDRERFVEPLKRRDDDLLRLPVHRVCLVPPRAGAERGSRSRREPQFSHLRKKSLSYRPQVIDVHMQVFYVKEAAWATRSVSRKPSAFCAGIHSNGFSGAIRAVRAVIPAKAGIQLNHE